MADMDTKKSEILYTPHLIVTYVDWMRDGGPFLSFEVQDQFFGCPGSESNYRGMCGGPS